MFFNFLTFFIDFLILISFNFDNLTAKDHSLNRLNKRMKRINKNNIKTINKTINKTNIIHTITTTVIKTTINH